MWEHICVAYALTAPEVKSDGLFWEVFILHLSLNKVCIYCGAITVLLYWQTMTLVYLIKTKFILP